MTATALRIENTGRQGDVWGQSWTRTVGTRTYNAGTLLVQIRTVEGTLVASSGAQGATAGIVQLVTTDTDFSGDPIVFAWSSDGADTTAISADGQYVLEAECEIDGALTTFYSHPWIVLPQYAIAAP